MRVWIALGAISAFFGVLMGAAGSHVAEISQASQTTFEVANLSHMTHAIGTILAALAMAHLNRSLCGMAAGLLLVGSITFIVPLYLASMVDFRALLTVMAPLGGTAMMLGWVVLAVAALKKNPNVA